MQHRGEGEDQAEHRLCRHPRAFLHGFPVNPVAIIGAPGETALLPEAPEAQIFPAQFPEQLALFGQHDAGASLATASTMNARAISAATMRFSLKTAIAWLWRRSALCGSKSSHFGGQDCHMVTHSGSTLAHSRSCRFISAQRSCSRMFSFFG